MSRNAARAFSRDPKLWKEKSGDQGHPVKKPSAADHDESNWLMSYADMMTLLCGFFVLLFSLAKLDEPKYDKLKQEVVKQFGGKYEAPPSKDLAGFFQETFQNMGLADKTIVKYDSLGVSVTFQSTMFFDTLSAEVNPEGRAILEKIIATLAERQAAEQRPFKIVVEGHTDARPVTGGDFATNWELSGARASRVVRLFVDHQFDPKLMTSVGYGDTRPLKAVEPGTLTTAEEEKAHIMNRRVVIRVLDAQAEKIPFPENDKDLTPAASAH